MPRRPLIRRRRRRISSPRRQAAVGARVQAARRGAVPGFGRSPWRRLVPVRPQDRAFAPRIHGLARHRVDRARFPLRQRRDPYPASVQDINYAVRWAKPNARDLKTRPELIGLSGQSSGGHLAMLVAMRPHDPRYTAIALPAGSPRHDASVRAVVMSWPVINPLGALSPRQARARAPIRRNGRSRSWRGRTPIGARKPIWPRAIRCWRSSAAKKLQLPPAIWFQGRGDSVHDYKDAGVRFSRQRAAALCRRLPKGRRRRSSLHYIEMDRHAGHSPDLSKISATCSRTWWNGSAGTSQSPSSARAKSGEGRQSPPPRAPGSMSSDEDRRRTRPAGRREGS